MKAKDAKYIRSVVMREGFHYAFCYYSEFNEVKDPYFHKLRKAYVRAANALARYLRGHDERR